jgi:hypothetical protein
MVLLRASRRGQLRTAAQFPERRYSFSAAAAGDVTGDGVSDVVSTEFGDFPGFGFEGGTRVAVIRGRRHGRPRHTPLTPTFYRVSDVVVADVNGDRREDIVVSYYDHRLRGVALFLARRHGLPTLAQDIPMGVGAIQQIDAGDVNGDGRADVVAMEGSGAVMLLHGKPAGRLSRPREVAHVPNGGPRHQYSSIAVGRVDSNRRAYLVVAVSGSRARDSKVMVYRSGRRHLLARRSQPAGRDLSFTGPPLIGDFDGDRAADVALITPVKRPPRAQSFVILGGDHHGRLTCRVSVPVGGHRRPGEGVRAITAGRLNSGDRRLDLVAVRTEFVSVLRAR